MMTSSDLENDQHRIRSYLGLELFALLTDLYLLDSSKNPKRIETWLRSSESDETLLEALEIVVKRIREQTLMDFEEFMMPRARESLQKFWSGAMGNAVKRNWQNRRGQ